MHVVALEVAHADGVLRLFAWGRPGAPPVYDARYILRPETVESLFLAYRLTGDEKYRRYGWEIFSAIEKHCKIETGGYASVLNVDAVPVEHEDKMETFLMVRLSPSLVTVDWNVCTEYECNVLLAERDAEVFVLAVRGRLGRAAEQCVIPSSLVDSIVNISPIEYVFNTEANPLPIINPTRHANF